MSDNNAALDRTVYLYNPGATAVQIAATYFGGNGATATATYSVAPGSIQQVDVVADTQSSLPPGPLGAEFKLAAGSGGFIAYSVGHTSDNLSATEDVGAPAY